MDLSNNYIYCNDIEKFFLPPDLTSLDISDNYIKDDTSTNLILPPNIQTLSIIHNNYMRLCNENILLERTRSKEGIKRYNPIKWYYENTIQKEICRGLIYGETENQTFRFLKKIKGSKNIRKNILMFYNPFLRP